MAEKTPSTKEIIAKGKAEFRVKRAGVFQLQEFEVKKGMSPNGEYPYLFIDKFIDLAELMRVSEEARMPVVAKNGSIFPRGTSSKDFADLLK